MKIKWLGHAAFLITSDKGTRIVLDPYESGKFGDAFTYGAIKEKADVVVISHDHADHNCLEGIQGSPQVVRGSGSHGACDIDFKGVAAYHDNSQGKERGDNIMAAFTVDGVRLCHMGDLGHSLTDQQLAELGPVDVLLLPIGGLYTIDAAEATRLVGKLAPRAVIPMHYKNDKCQMPLAEVDDFLKGKERVRRVGSSEVEIKKDSLPPRTEVIVLEHAL